MFKNICFKTNSHLYLQYTTKTHTNTIHTHSCSQITLSTVHHPWSEQQTLHYTSSEATDHCLQLWALCWWNVFNTCMQCDPTTITRHNTEHRNRKFNSWRMKVNETKLRNHGSKSSHYSYNTRCLKKTVQNCFCQKFVKFQPILYSFFETQCRQDNLSVVSAALLADTLLSSVILYRQHTHTHTGWLLKHILAVGSSSTAAGESFIVLMICSMTTLWLCQNRHTHTYSTAAFTPVRSTFTRCLVFMSNTETLRTVKNSNENNARPLYAQQAGWG